MVQGTVQTQKKGLHSMEIEKGGVGRLERLANPDETVGKEEPVGTRDSIRMLSIKIEFQSNFPHFHSHSPRV